MSKKDRLKKEKEKQLEMMKKSEQVEKEYKENFTESKIAKKYKKKTRPSEPKFYLVSKLLMLIPLGWSAFWGGVMSIAILMGLVNEFDFTQFTKKTAVIIVGGIFVLVIALALEFWRKYILGFVMSLAGCVLYIKGVNQFVKPIEEYLVTHVVDSLEGYTDLWKMRCYPMWIFVAISALILAVKMISKLVEKKKAKAKLDNAPVKSIISD